MELSQCRGPQPELFLLFPDISFLHKHLGRRAEWERWELCSWCWGGRSVLYVLPTAQACRDSPVSCSGDSFEQVMQRAFPPLGRSRSTISWATLCSGRKVNGEVDVIYDTHIWIWFQVILLSREGNMYFPLGNDLLLTSLTHQESSLFPFSFLCGESTPVLYLSLSQVYTIMFAGMAVLTRNSHFWITSLCWQNLWQQFWQHTAFVALVYIVWGYAEANAAARNGPSIPAYLCWWLSVV